MIAARHFIRDKHGERGPYTRGQLDSMWASGALTADASYRPENMDRWYPLTELMEDESPLTTSPKPQPMRSFRLATPEPYSAKDTPKKKAGCAVVTLGVIILVLAVSIIGSLNDSAPSSSNASPSRGGPNVSIRYDAFSVHITNQGSADWKEAIIYINGQPPFAYKATMLAPGIGQTITVGLREFVDKSGNRFDPLAKAVTELWIGGSGYDYQSFRGSR